MRTHWESDSITFTGPFPNAEAARDWAENNYGDVKRTWGVIEMPFGKELNIRIRPPNDDDGEVWPEVPIPTGVGLDIYLASLKE